MRIINASHSLLADHSGSGADLCVNDHGMSLSIVATTDAGTCAALAAARALGAGLDPHVVLLVRHVVPHLQPLDHRAGAVALLEDRFRRLAEEAGTHAIVR